MEDLQGRKYYRTGKVMALPLERMGAANEFVMWMSAGMTATNLTELVGVVKEAMNTIYTEINSKDKKQNAIIRAGAAINEIEMATQTVMHTDLLYQFVACHYIREDEPIFEYNPTVQEEKVKAFKDMVSHGGAYAFFSQVKELSNLNVFTNSSPEEFQELWKSSIKKQERLQKITEFLKSKQKFEQAKKTLKANS